MSPEEARRHSAARVLQRCLRVLVARRKLKALREKKQQYEAGPSVIVIDVSSLVQRWPRRSGQRGCCWCRWSERRRRDAPRSRLRRSRSNERSLPTRRRYARLHLTARLPSSSAFVSAYVRPASLTRVAAGHRGGCRRQGRQWRDRTAGGRRRRPGVCVCVSLAAVALWQRAQADAVRLLLEHGANPNARGKFNRTPLFRGLLIKLTHSTLINRSCVFGTHGRGGRAAVCGIRPEAVRCRRRDCG